MAAIEDDPVKTIPVTRALRRSRGRWRVLAFIALAIAIGVAALRVLPGIGGGPGTTIARVSISGTIASDGRRTAALRELAHDDSVLAVVVAINSGGGTTAGGEELYHTIRAIAEHKPVVATIAELGASAAYMTALGADRIVARNLSMVGSIGVFYQHVDASGLLDTIGVDLEKVASGPLKGRPDINEPITPEVRESLEVLVDSSYQYFVDLVAGRRGLTRPRTLALADGRILTGASGVELGLVDETGGEAEALAWLATAHDIDPDLPLRTVWPRQGAPDWIDLVLGRAAGALFGEGARPGLPLDGLVSLWHPADL